MISQIIRPADPSIDMLNPDSAKYDPQLYFSLKQKADADRQSVAALQDLVGEQTDMMFASLAAALPHIRSGRVRPLAVTGNQRHPALKDVPTMEEIGLKGFDAQQWYGVVGPAGMPAPIVRQLNEAMAQVLAQPDFKDKLSAEAVELMPMSPIQFADYIKKDLARWTQLARVRNINLDAS